MYLGLLKYLLMVGGISATSCLPLMYLATPNVVNIAGGAKGQSDISSTSKLETISRSDTQPHLVSRTANLSKDNFAIKELKSGNLKKSSEIWLTGHKTPRLQFSLPSQKRPNEDGEGHYLFFKYLWEILIRTLWADEVNVTPWIHAVKGELYPVKTRNLKNYLIKESKSGDFEEYLVEFTRESLDSLKKMGSGKSSRITTPIRKAMEELFLRFISPNWEADSSVFKSKSSDKSLVEVRLNHFQNDSADYPTHAIRLIREYSGKNYSLDIVFNVRPGSNQLYVPAIFDGKEHYLANGEKGVSKSHIGGTVTLTNELDKSFASMFENLDSDPSHFYRSLTAVGKCLENYSICGALLPMKSVNKLNFKLRNKPVHRIHPFSDIYWDVIKNWKQESDNFHLNWVNNLKS